MLLGGIKPKRLFGSVLVEGNFGSGKTFFTEFESYELAFKNKDYLIISNIPFSRVDIPYNSFEDFTKILDNIYRYFVVSNSELKEMDKYKNILLIMDEVHLYFPSRKSMDKSRAKIRDKLNVVLTQCRKRNVRFMFITQRVQKTDIEFRRLSEFIYYLNMSKFLGMKINRLSIIRAGGGISDLIGEDGTTRENEEALKKDIIYSGLAKHNTFYFSSMEKIKHKDFPLWKEKHITNFICGVKPLGEDGEYLEDNSDSIYNQSFEDFYKMLLKTPTTIKPVFKMCNQDKIPIFCYGQKFYDYENSKKLFDFKRKYYKIIL